MTERDIDALQLLPGEDVRSGCLGERDGDLCGLTLTDSPGTGTPTGTCGTTW
ncbi:ALQxL family class IV lanthipeptide [Streptomyces sp. NPDC058417]|uniref:ALQxL family class IV lanthipeptide n=1 Tax=unclassified Streptomyces TaxID=2593676 RepID=UPI00365B8DDA